jgi:hypothetical protein
VIAEQSGALLERMATSGVDIVSLDWTVTVPEARKRIGNDIGIQVRIECRCCICAFNATCSMVWHQAAIATFTGSIRSAGAM